MRSFVSLLLLFSSIALSAQTTPPTPSGKLVIAHVTVIDVERGRALPDMAIVIDENRIEVVTSTSNVRVPANARVIDAAGKFLMPGLWDMHSHVVRTERVDAFLPLVVAAGVTGIRDMGTAMPLADVEQVRNEIATGQRIGPRIVAAGRILDGPKPINPTVSVAISGPREGRDAVRRHKESGADFIKVYSLLTRDAFFAIADEAKRRGLPLTGHVPASVTAAEAARAGQVSMEHMFGVTEGCSTQEDELRRRTLAEGKGVSLIRSRADALDSYSPTKARKLFRVFVNNQTWHVPSLVNQHAGVHRDKPVDDADPRWKYIPPSMQERWKRSSDGPMVRAFTGEAYAKLKQAFERQLALIGEMNQAGVRFMTGTDTPVAFMFPGFSVHEELEFFVRAGLTPAEALQTATINPARFLKMEKKLGSVAQGKIADLVLLSENPLIRISNTQTIDAVIANGRYLGRAALDQTLADIEAAVKKQ